MMLGTLWYGGTIYTMKKVHEKVEAVFAEGGVIKEIGDEKDLRLKYTDQIVKEVNLQGAVMFPGFVDSHLHIIGHGEKLIRLDLSAINSSKKMAEVLRKRVELAEDDEWIIGEGWNENQLVDRKIFHRDELDEIAPNNPMMLTRVCRHAVLANSKAMELAGVTDETEDPPGGVIVRDSQGKATGYLLDQAQELIKNAIPEVSKEFIKNALSVSIDDLLSKGVVGGHSEDLNYYGGFKRTFDSFLEVIDGKNKKFRADLLVHHEVVEDMYQEGYQYQGGSSFVKVNAVKIFADGALGGRTALLSQPYNDVPETSGVAIHELTELKEIVKKARTFNMPVAIHTIGDLAFEYALEAIEQYPPLAGQRDRLIHAQVLRKDLIERVQHLPVVLDIQPQFVASDFPWVIERLGEERMKYAYAWKTLLKNNIPCAGGSDAPIESVNPLLGIHAAVTRRHPDEDHAGFYPEEKLTAYEAIKLYTIGSAYAIHQEHNRGFIDRGYVADFSIFDRDLITCDPDGILEAKVKMTVVDNTIVYARGGE